MDYTYALGVIMIVLVCAVLLKEFGSRSVPVLVSLCSLVIISYYLDSFGELIGVIDRLTFLANCEDYAKAGLKIVGIGYLSGIASDVCSDLGEGGLARLAAVTGRLEIAVVCIPFLEKIIGSIENVF